MSIETIQLYPDDDINSIRDRLDWADSERIVLAVPDEGELLTRKTDLAILARHADGLRVQVGFISTDPTLRKRAESFGFPTFLTQDLAETSPRVWRRHRVRPEDRLGYQPADLNDVLLEAAAKRRQATKEQMRPEWQRWARSITFVLLGAVTLTFFISAIGLVTPSATITITPAREKVTVRRLITADPAQPFSSQPDIIGGENTTIIVDWEASMVPTGQAQLGANRSSGTVVFVNLNDEPVEIPAGTVLQTGSEPPIQFQTITPTSLPNISGSTAEANILAQEVGPQGNLLANSIILFEDGAAWEQRVEIRQPSPTAGGDIQPVPVVLPEDIMALRSETLQQLESIGANKIEAGLANNKFLVHESLNIMRIIAEERSHQAGEASNTITINIQAEIGGTVIDMNQATDVVYTDLVNAVRPGYSLTPDSFRFYQVGNNTVRNDRTIEFEMVGEGTMTAVSNTDQLLEEIAGKEEADAITFLQTNLELDGKPIIRIIPNWFGRMPSFANRIEVIINE